MIRNGGKYASLILGASALVWLAQHGVTPLPNPLRPDEYLIDERQISQRTWTDLIQRKDVIFCLVWFFVTSGTTTTLPSDFNTASNQINVIGNGAGGTGGGPGGNGTSGGGSCPSGSASGC
jgi:hypothetical protein